MSADPTDLDSRLAELTEIRERLAVSDDPGERQTLRDRQRELRSQSADDRLKHLPLQQLTALERSLAAEQEQKLKRRFDIGAVGMGGRWSDGLDPVMVMEHNQQVDESSGLAPLQQKLAEVRSEIAGRTSES